MSDDAVPRGRRPFDVRSRRNPVKLRCVEMLHPIAPPDGRCTSAFLPPRQGANDGQGASRLERRPFFCNQSRARRQRSVFSAEPSARNRTIAARVNARVVAQSEGLAMQQLFNQLVQFVQQGIAAIFRFVQLIWTWSVGQITKVIEAPWQNWPFWKQILLVLVAGGGNLGPVQGRQGALGSGRTDARRLRDLARRFRQDAAESVGCRGDRARAACGSSTISISRRYACRRRCSSAHVEASRCINPPTPEVARPPPAACARRRRPNAPPRWPRQS